jgi:hypothetical protein
MVSKASADPFLGPHTIHPPVPHVQYTTTIIATVAPDYKFGFLVHAHPLVFWVVQWLCVQFMHDVRSVVGAQPEIEGTER